MKIKCKCGREFKSVIDFKIHFELGKPSRVIASRLTGITLAQEEQSIKEVEQYKENHSMLLKKS